MSTTPTSGRIGPAMNQDTEFFWQGARRGVLLIQRCAACGVLRHPPGPACPHCHGLEWDVTEASGRGTLFSYTVLHRPLAPGFTAPAVVGLVELREGVRLIANIDDADPDTLSIGEPMEVFMLDQDEGWTAPQFRRVRALTPPA